MIEKYDILIVRGSKKNRILQEEFHKKLIPVKIISIEEITSKYNTQFDKRAIYYLMKKYNYQYDIAKMYIKTITQIQIESSNNPKITKCLELKQELQENKFEIENKPFRQYLNNKKILIYKIDDLTKEEKKILNTLSKSNEITFKKETIKTYIHPEIIECSTEEDEVIYTANQIMKLLKKGINIEKIKICASSNYEDTIERIFKWYHLPISINKKNLYTTEIGQYFLRNLEESKEETLKKLEEKYPHKNPKNLEIYNQILKIINKYTWCDYLKEIKPFLEEDLKKTKPTKVIKKNTINVIDTLENISTDDEIFLLGFNQGEIPKTYQDEEYLNDTEKQELELETTKEKNERNYITWLNRIKTTKNLTITMKKNSKIGECYISSLNDDLKATLIKVKKEYTHSNLYNQIELSKKLDTLIKYNELEEDTTLLFNHYPNINYRTYQHKYNIIDKKRIRNYLNYQLNLSYSNINTYYQCAYRYYLSNILKLTPYQETLDTIIGNAFHHVLSLSIKKEINIKEEYNNYLKELTYPFTERDKYFLNKLEKELEFIIETIKSQSKDTKLNNIYTEEKIEIDSKYEDTSITLKGFIDKMLLNQQEDKIAIIDYKTGATNLNLNNIIYGLDLQLPIYIYLAKHKFKQAKLIGFYLQKILNTEITKDTKTTYLKQKEENLKLQGYSTTDESRLKEFDPNYENSTMIKGMKKTSKGISTKKVLNDEQIEMINSITKEKIENAIQNILNANFKINPKKIGMNNVGCMYCKFRDICFRQEEDIETLIEHKNLDFLGGEENDTEETE